MWQTALSDTFRQYPVITKRQCCQSASTRLPTACWVSSCFEEGQGHGYTNDNSNCSLVRSEVCQIRMVCSFRFKWTALLNSHKYERMLHVASLHSHNTFAVTFGPTTGKLNKQMDCRQHLEGLSNDPKIGNVITLHPLAEWYHTQTLPTQSSHLLLCHTVPLSIYVISCW